MTRRYLTSFVAALAMTATATLACARPSNASTDCTNALPTFGPGADYHPTIDPSRFSPNVTNPLMPLPPGTTWLYEGVKDGKKAVDVVVATQETRMVDGVKTRVVADRLFLDGILEERTSDYYAQDDCGNVWYFGEDTAELDKAGKVTSTEGSFHAGVDGAQPGVFMQASLELNRMFRQEWYAGHAEDVFQAIDLHASVKVPYGSFRNALRTAETTDLEPDVKDNKYYVRGIGEVEELAVKGPTEKLELVEVVR